MLLKDVLGKVDGLTEEQQKAILEAAGGDSADIKEESDIQEATNLQNQLETANNTIKELQKKGGNKAGVEEIVKNHKTEIEKIKKESEAAIKSLHIDHAIESFLSRNNAKYPDLLAGKFDREKIQTGADGKPTNIEEIGKAIMESYKEMFAGGLHGHTPDNPDASGKPGGDAYTNLVNNAGKMSAEEVAAQLAAINGGDK